MRPGQAGAWWFVVGLTAVAAVAMAALASRSMLLLMLVGIGIPIGVGLATLGPVAFSSPSLGVRGLARGLALGGGFAGVVACLMLSFWLWLTVLMVVAAACPLVWHQTREVLRRDRLAYQRRRRERDPIAGELSGPTGCVDAHLPAGSRQGGTPDYDDVSCAAVDALADAVDDAIVPSMTGSELCRAWRQSYLVLQAAPDPWTRARVVACRQRYLDQIAAVSPQGLAGWLRATPRAASGPDRFVR